MPDISIIIVNYNLAESISDLLDSIKKHLSVISYEVFVIDNNSSQREIELLPKKYSWVNFIFLDKNYGFGIANNKGIENSKGEFILLLNPDTLLIDNSIELMVKSARENESWGVIGPKVYLPTGRIQETALKFPNIRYEIYSLLGILSFVIKCSKNLRKMFYKKPFYKTDFIFGSCMLIKRKVNNIIKGFDPDYFLFSEETDYCYRVKNNTKYKIIYFENAKILHNSSKITGSIPSRRIKWSYESKLLFIHKHYSFIYNLFFRFAVILYQIKRLIGLGLKNGNLENSKELRETYFYIIKYYFLGKPVKNKNAE